MSISLITEDMNKLLSKYYRKFDKKSFIVTG
jgi:hypothetical protein